MKDFHKINTHLLFELKHGSEYPKLIRDSNNLETLAGQKISLQRAHPKNRYFIETHAWSYTTDRVTGDVKA